MNSEQLSNLLDQCGPLLGPADLAPIFHVSVSHFYKLARSGAFDMFKVRPAIGSRCYSKALVLKYLAGERISESTRHFGRKRATRRVEALSAAKAS